jgi:hypothetical protein
MGGRKSRPPKPVPIAIPNYPFPRNILQYLMSQSGAYTISFTTPDGDMGNVQIDITETDTSFSPESDFAFSYAVPTRSRVSTNAYTTTLAPTPTPRATNPSNPPRQSVSAASLPGNMPSFWVAAIRGMEYVTRIGKISTYEQLDEIFTNIAGELNSYGGVSSVIYFCTVITKLLEPFQYNFVYNNLNKRYPTIFKDVSAYQRILIVKLYSRECSMMLNRLPIVTGNGYIKENDRVMIYGVPIIIKSIKDRLANTNPISKL